jgi:hypothetical protein
MVTPNSYTSWFAMSCESSESFLAESMTYDELYKVDSIGVIGS